MAWRRPGDKPLSEPVMVSLLTHYASLTLSELRKLYLELLLKFSSKYAKYTEIHCHFSIVLNKNTEMCVNICKNTEILPHRYCSEFPVVGNAVMN